MEENKNIMDEQNEKMLNEGEREQVNGGFTWIRSDPVGREERERAERERKQREEIHARTIAMQEEVARELAEVEQKLKEHRKPIDLDIPRPKSPE